MVVCRAERLAPRSKASGALRDQRPPQTPAERRRERQQQRTRSEQRDPQTQN